MQAAAETRARRGRRGSEEVATISALLRMVERSRENPVFVEEYLAREHPGGESEDPTAPPVAGGAV